MGEDGGTIVNEPGSNPSAVPQVRQRSFSKYTRAWQVGQWSERMRLLFPCSPARNTTDTTVQHHVRVSQSPEVVASTGADAWNRIIEPPIEPPSTQMPNPAGSPWLGYSAPGWDEMLGPDAPRPGCAGVMGYLDQLGDELHDRQEAAELAIASMGISFTVYAEKGNIDRAWPFDVIPRVIDLREWEQVSKGLIQRLRALNLFIGDLYGEARVLADGIVPAEIVKGSPNYRPECIGIRPPQGTWAHISGSDLVRGGDGVFRVLEDNLRVPSGVAYMLENRQISKRVFADAFRSLDIQPVDGYPTRLQEMLASLTPRPGERAGDRRAHARASTTPPTSSTPSSPRRWARCSSRATTSWSATTTCAGCARSAASCRST